MNWLKILAVFYAGFLFDGLAIKIKSVERYLVTYTAIDYDDKNVVENTGFETDLLCMYTIGELERKIRTQKRYKNVAVTNII